MKNYAKLVIISALFIAGPQLSLAVQRSGQVDPIPSSSSATATIERGGTVTAINLRKKTIAVDLVSYATSAGTFKIHSLSNETSNKLTELRPGMQIRFFTSKNNFSHTEQVVEIWVTSKGAF